MSLGDNPPGVDPPARSPRQVTFRMWDGVYPPAICQAVIDHFDETWYYDAEIQTPHGETLVDPATRQAQHLFVEPGHWVGALVSHFAHQANFLWRYDITGLGTLSIIRYGEGGQFTWHVDVLAYDQVEYPELGAGLERKLSVSVNLSDPEEYDGGELQFLNGTGQLFVQQEMRNRGSVAVFPSTVGHRVTPVTRGVRYALVGWMVGPPLR